MTQVYKTETNVENNETPTLTQKSSKICLPFPESAASLDPR